MKRLFGFAVMAMILSTSIAHAQVDDTRSEAEKTDRCAMDSKYIQEAVAIRMGAEDDLRTLQVRIQQTRDQRLLGKLHAAEIKLVKAQSDEADLTNQMNRDCAQ